MTKETLELRDLVFEYVIVGNSKQIKIFYNIKIVIKWIVKFES